MGVSGQFHVPAALYPRGKDPRYPLDRRLGALALVVTYLKTYKHMRAWCFMALSLILIKTLPNLSIFSSSRADVLHPDGQWEGAGEHGESHTLSYVFTNRV
jgi:hypothetical protein